ncbi:MAG: hypothetical protein L6420_07765 [Elusimicrobia bacterium]|nr:hypothetical protein [Elusimicrobiota bacterium]
MLTLIRKKNREDNPEVSSPLVKQFDDKRIRRNTGSRIGVYSYKFISGIDILPIVRIQAGNKQEQNPKEKPELESISFNETIFRKFRGWK